MRRREAVILFKEICERIPDALVTGASLTQTNRSDNLELKIIADLDDKSLKILKLLAEKRKLAIRESIGSLSIYEAKQDSLEAPIVA